MSTETIIEFPYKHGINSLNHYKYFNSIIRTMENHLEIYSDINNDLYDPQLAEKYKVAIGIVKYEMSIFDMSKID